MAPRARELEQLREIHAGATRVLMEEPDDKKLAELRERAKRLEAASAGAHRNDRTRDRDIEAEYPALDDVNFEKRLLGRLEFSEHAKVPDIEESGEACGKSGQMFELTRAQLVVRNFIAPGSPYNGLLLFHGVGVGKTCAALVIAEANARHLKNGVTVVTKRGLIDDFQKALFDPARIPKKEDGTPDYEIPVHCSGTAYADAISDKAMMTKDQVAARIADKIQENYRFHSPVTFANEVASLTTDANGAQLERATADRRIRDRFAFSVLAIDEAHNIRGNETKQMASALKRVVAVTPNLKLVLMTATPMFNHASDILPIVNMLLLNDGRPQVSLPSISSGAQISASDAAALAKAVRGYISFMPGSDPLTFPVRLSPTDVGDSQRITSEIPTIDIFGKEIDPGLRVSGCPVRQWILGSAFAPEGIHRLRCQELQENVPIIDFAEESEMTEDIGGEDALASPQPGSRFHKVSALMQAQNIIFPPEGDFGSGGFNRAFRVRKDSVDYATDTRFLEPRWITEYAPKLASVVDRVISCEGVSIVYSRFISSGLVPLAIALEHRGFRRFMASPILGGSTGESGGAGRQGSYAIISSSVFASPSEATLRTLNLAENADGSKIRVVLISDKGSEGITIKHAREVHVLEPWFHMNKLEQVVGRGARFCSHSTLPPERRNITAYYHAMTDGRTETLDMHMYRISGLKQRGIDAVERILQERAFDCNIHAPYRASLAAYLQSHKIDLRTAQGRVIRGYIRRAPAGHECVPKIANLEKQVSRVSYDESLHGHGHYAYKLAISGFYRDNERVVATFDELWAHVSDILPFPEEARMGHVLAHMVGSKLVFDIGKACEGGARMGFIIRRGERYLFQPLDEGETMNLLDQERIQASPKSFHRISLKALSRPAAADQAPGDLVSSLGDLDIKRIAGARLQRAGLPEATYSAAAVDSVIDQLDASSLLRLCMMVFQDRAGVPAEVVSSLKSAGILMPDEKSFRSPYSPGVMHAWDGESLKEVRGGARLHKAPDPSTYLGIMSLTNNRQIVFKVNDNDPSPQARKNKRGAVKSGCICHQNNMTTSRLRDYIKKQFKDVEDVPRASRQAIEDAVDKRQLCALFELLLRRHRPDMICRPIASAA